METVRFENVAWLVAICACLIALARAARALIARRTSGRLAQLRFRRLHGERVVELLGGRLDPRPSSPWIDTYVGGRAAQLVAAPLAGSLQAGIALLQHDLPVNVWDSATSAADADVEVLPGIDPRELDEIVDALRIERVDSLACGVPVASEPRPPHVVRMRFDEVDQLPEALQRIATLLERIEALAPTANDTDR